MASLFPFFQWCDSSWLGATIRNSAFLFPVIEMFHLFALTVLLGTTIVLSLRLFGVMFQNQPFSELAGNLQPWNLWSMAVMLVTGSLLFSSEAVKCYGNDSFRAKMVFLFLALLFRFTLYPKLTGSWGKLAGGLSLALWFSVGLAGRAIGFLG
ncbi:MAG TPA: DUF6644 family protein [Bryobacteraceae bacterium]|nr:DUF6644 family protein [Bryobacteraceae bacterium]